MTNTAWALYWRRVGNENYLTAKQLLELSPRVESFYRRFALVSPDTAGGEEYIVDWLTAANSIEADGMSSSEMRLAHLVAGLICGREGETHLIDLNILGYMGSWTDDVLRILVKWASDGRLDVTGRFLAGDPWVQELHRASVPD